MKQRLYALLVVVSLGSFLISPAGDIDYPIPHDVPEVTMNS